MCQYITTLVVNIKTICSSYHYNVWTALLLPPRVDISETKVVRNKTGHRRITSVAATAVHRRNDGRNRVFVREVCERRSFVGIRISIRRLADIASTLVACFGVYVGVGIA